MRAPVRTAERKETSAREGVRVLLSELPPDWEPYLYHLLTCEPCRTWAAGRLAESAERAAELYDPAFERLLARTGETVAEGRRRRGAAEGLLAELMALAPRKRGRAVEEPRFRSHDLAELLLDRSAEAQLGDPARAEELAGCAVTLSLHLEDGSEAAFQTLFRAWCLAGNARRLQGKLGEAEASYLLASLGQTGRADRAALCRGLALLRREQGRVEEAAALLAEAARDYAEEMLGKEAGTCQALLGLVLLDEGVTARALQALRRAAPLLDPGERPWLAARAALAEAVCLAELGDLRGAREKQGAAWGLYGEIEGEEAVALQWLEGRLAARAGKPEEGRLLLAAVREHHLARAALPEAALATLDLALLLAETGRGSEVAALGAELEAALPGERERTRALAALAALAGAESQAELRRRAARAASRLRRKWRYDGASVEPLPFV